MDTMNQIKKAYAENGYDLENLEGAQKISVKLTEARLWMLSGLHNFNRQQYNKGLKRYMKYSEEILSSGKGFTAVREDSIYHFDNSEALRQSGIDLKKDYEAFKKIEESVFG